MRAKYGIIIDKVLYKRGAGVVKYWTKNGYAVPVEEFQQIEGVKLYSRDDGNLYASKETFDQHATPHLYYDEEGKLEHQLILGLQHWKIFNSKENENE